MKIIRYILLGLNVLGLAIFIDSSLFSILGNISWILLLLIVYSSPLSNIFNKIKFLNKIVKIRKELGILCATLGIAHSIGFFINTGGFLYILDLYYWRLDNGFGYGVYALIISIPLLITSNIASIKLLGKYWKIIQRLTYVFFIFVTIHIALIKPQESMLPIILLILWLIIWFVVYFKNKSLINN